MSKSKYGARKTVIDGITFDSAKEARRWAELRLLERAGEIEGLVRQVKFELIPANDRFRACTYIADFVYMDKDGHLVVEDTKGYRTAEYRIKQKLMYDRHRIEIQEV